MTPRSENTAEAIKARQDLEKALEAAKAKRDKVFEDTDKRRAQAEADYWRTVDALLTDAYHGAKTDAVRLLGVTRDHILKQTKKHRTQTNK
ncbi:hypothetical protein AB0H07_39090 [Streptomyces sp. NPDC021354]|uniref:hypothetical protein n=1 Tax=Streptomyces sp. NPDC021354 TaxID=3154793 RepID=UPI0033C7B1CB